MELCINLASEALGVRAPGIVLSIPSFLIWNRV